MNRALLAQRTALIAAGTCVSAVIFYKKFLGSRFFASMWSKEYALNCEGKMDEIKNELFEPLHQMVRVSEDDVKVLEIGVGPGFNFKYYPDGIEYIAIDPNRHFEKSYDENRQKYPKIQSKKLVVGKGENLNMIPDSSVDVVVCTLIFCSVSNMQKILEEIKRVLKKDGKYFFLEHVKQPKFGVTSLIQAFLSYSGLWPLVYDGCMLNRDFCRKLHEANFSKTHLELIELPFPSFANPGARGYSIK